MLDYEQSWMEFQYGLTKKEECVQTVPIKKIFLEKSWKLEIGEYRDTNSLAYSGKDIAIVLLRRQIKATEYPQLLPYDGSTNKDFQIQVYGYPGPCRDDHQDASILRVGTGDVTLTKDNCKDGWVYLRHKMHGFHGMYMLFICVMHVF